MSERSGVKFVVIVLLLVLLGSVGMSMLESVQASSDVPAEYQQLYSTLETSLDNYNAYLDSHSSGESYPVIFGVELLPANSNRGTDLLAPQTMQAVSLYLDRLQELGVQGVTMSIGYPLYTPNFPHYQDYVQFYKQVVQEVRKRGMKIDVESAVLFANTEFSTLNVNYTGLTFDQFKTERRQMIAAIVQDLKPDYLNLGAEPDTEYQLIGLKELNSPEKYTEYISYVLTGLDRGSTKIGAGIGTWGNMEYVNSLASKTSLDSIHIHVYPINGNYLQNILAITAIAKQYGKRAVLDEAWLYKVDKPSPNGVAASGEIFRRDVFSFWAPLDQKFLAVIVKSARIANIEYISPFWTQLFFGYVDYSSNTASLSYKELSSLVNQAASKNILADQFTSPGEFYGQMTSARSSTSTTTRQGSTNSALDRIPGFAVGLLIAVVVIGVVALIVLLRRRPKDSLG